MLKVKNLEFKYRGGKGNTLNLYLKLTAKENLQLIAYYQMRSEGKTIFLTTHNMTIAEQLCDRVALLVDGQISLCDSMR